MLIVERKLVGTLCERLHAQGLAIDDERLKNSGTGVGLLIAIIGVIMFGIYFFRNYEIKLK